MDRTILPALGGAELSESEQPASGRGGEVKAWEVSARHDGDYREVVFADTRAKAIRQSSLLGDFGGEWTEMRAVRAKSFDGDPRILMPRDYIEHGYGYECLGCYSMVHADEDFPPVFTEKGFVYCSQECLEKHGG